MTLFLLGTYLCIGIVFVAAAAPLVQGRIAPNYWYGVRVPKTLNDRDTWYAVNAYFGRRWAVLGLVTAVAALLLAPTALIPVVGSIGYMVLNNLVILAGFVWIAADTFRYLRKF